MGNENRCDKAIYALGIRHIGETNARLLARHYGTLDAFLDGMKAAGKGEESEAYQELNNIGGIGEVVADALVEFFREKHNREALDRLFKQIEVEPMEKVKSDSAISGKTVVFTGTLEKMTRPGSQGAGRAARRQGRGLGVEEDRLRGGGPGRGLEADRGAEPWREGADSEDEWLAMTQG